MKPNRGFIDRHLATAPASDYDQPWSFLALVVALEPGHAQFWKEKWRPRRWIAMTSRDVRMPTMRGRDKQQLVKGRRRPTRDGMSARAYKTAAIERPVQSFDRRARDGVGPLNVEERRESARLSETLAGVC
jgi:hypothetical protein